MELPENKKNLKQKVEEWLASEGYPLEYYATSIFHRYRFSVDQSYYVLDAQSNSPREIDLLADVTSFVGDSLLRIAYVVECKWSGDKPWVVFTSDLHIIAPSACIAQTIGNETGEAILWSIAGDDEIQSLQSFNTPSSAGFNGRQALSKGNDVFYNAMQSVTSASNSLARSYDVRPQSAETAVKSAIIVFPVIVVNAILYAASFDTSVGQMRLEEADSIRVHWRGAETSNVPFTTVDIVTQNHLEKFVKLRSEEISIMFSRMGNCLKQLQKCVIDGNLAQLTITRGGRGMIGLPKLLTKIQKSGEMKK